jgi:murein DD-endopeptidase MepM/ murein hydrolase activator NlpD
MLLGVATPAHADDLQSAQQQLQAAKAQEKAAADKINGIEAQRAALRARRAVLVAEIAVDEARIAAENAKIDALDGELVDIGRQIEAKNNEQASRQRILNVRTRTLYKAEGAVSFIDALLSSNDFGQLVDRFLLMRDITHADQLLLAQIKETKAQIETLKANKQNDLAGEQTARGVIQQATASRNSELAAKLAADHQLGAQEKTQQDLQAQARATVAQKNQEIAALVQARKHAHSSGVFAWPGVQGPITQPFGCVDYSAEPPPPQPYSCPASRPYFHYGIDVGGPWGSQITAADSGIAYTYVSSYGYGIHVIIAHANGYATLYGHMSSFAISSGQTVAKGQLIGYEGSTGNSSGAHLHFEIDLNGTPVNPCNYVGC